MRKTIRYTLGGYNSMNIISNDDAIEIIKKKGISYIADLDNISYLIQEKEFVECWKSEDVLIILSKLSKTVNDIVNVIPLYERFEIDDLMAFVEEHCKMPTLLIPIQDLESNFAKELR